MHPIAIKGRELRKVFLRSPTITAFKLKSDSSRICREQGKIFLVGFQPTLAMTRGWDTPGGLTAKRRGLNPDEMTAKRRDLNAMTAMTAFFQILLT